MDPTEDVSARVLLSHILSTEPTRTPITRSSAKTQHTSTTRRSSRLSKKDAGAQTPQDLLRRSLRHKMRESITRQSLPATKRRTASVVLRKINTPASTSLLFDDGETPRHALMNILRTEPVKSPVVHQKATLEDTQSFSAESSITRKRPSIELSGFDLPDITIGNTASTEKGLNRKRPRRSLNVTAFEKRLKDGEEFEEQNEESVGDHSSLSLSSSTSLSLKTPFVNVQTERKGLQRRVSNRRKITAEEFGAAVNKRQMGGVSSFVQVKQGLSETAYSEDLSLGMSKLSEPDITTDILHCNTALYAKPDAFTSNFSIVATQDKPTVLASQLQRQMEHDEQMEEEQGKLGEDKSTYAFPTEEATKPLNEGCSFPVEEDANAAEYQKEGDDQLKVMSQEEEGIVESKTSVEDGRYESEEDNRVAVTTGAGDSESEEQGAADFHTEEDVATQSEEEESAPDTQTEEEKDGVSSQREEDVATQSEEEEAAPDSQTEEEQGGVSSQHEEDVATQSEEEEAAPDTQTEEEKDGVSSQHEEDVAARSQSEEEDDVSPDSQTEGEDAVHSQTEEEDAADLQSEEDVEGYQSDQEDPDTNSKSGDEDDLADSQPEDEHDGKPEEEDGELQPDLEHISGRAHRSEGGLKPVAEATGNLEEAPEAAHSSLETGSRESSSLHIENPDLTKSSTQGKTDAAYAEAEPDADKENSFDPPEAALDIEDGRHLSEESPEEAAGLDPAEQEEEWEDDEDDEESDEIPSKTPAFVKQKIHFLQPDPLASPSVFKNIQASSSTGTGVPSPKQKRVRQKRRGPSKKEAELPKTYLMSVFRHFAKAKVSADVYPVLREIMDKYFDRLAEDLETFAAHAKRKTIEVEDVELLLKRQGYVNDKVPVEVLIEKYLRMDQRKLLIPIASSGNVVIPKERR